MSELDLLLEEFNNELKEVKDKYEFMIKSTELNLSEEKYRDLIRKMGEDFYQISSELIDNVRKRKLAEQNLLESEKNYRFITENVNDVIIILDKDFKVEYINELPLKRIGGYQRDDLINKNGIHYIHPDDLAKVLKAFDKSFEIGEGSMEVRLKHKDGFYVWTEAKGNMVIDQKGQPKAHIIVRDISQRKIAEEKLRNSKERLRLINLNLVEQVETRNEELKESEEKYRFISENANDLITIIDENFKHEYINEAHKRIACYSNEDLIGTTPLERIHPEDRNKVFQVYKNGFISGEAQIIEFKYMKKDGTWMWLESIGKKFINRKGDVKGLIISRDITERKITDQRLKESEEKFRTIAEYSLIGITLVQYDQIKYVNRRIADMMGYSVNEMLYWDYKIMLKHIYREDVPLVMETIEKLLHKSEITSNKLEIRAVTKTGQIIWIENFYAQIQYDGNPAQLISSVDITERKLAEQKLKESEGKYKALFEESPYSIVLLDLDGNFVDCNPARLRIFGRTKEELIGNNFRELSLFPPEYQKIAEEAFYNLLKGKDVESIIIQSYDKEGKLIWIQIQGKIIQLDEKTLVQVITQDIHEIKKAEEKLRESEEKFRTIAEQSFMGIVILQDEQLKYVNEAAAKMFEYSLEEVMNWSKDYMAEKCIHPEDLPMLREKRELRRKGEFNLKPYISYRVLTKSGKIKWIDQFSRVIVYQGKEAELVTIIDITDQKEAEKLIKEENMKLLELDKMRKELMTRVSHELKTPLVSIYSCSELLIDYYKTQMSEEVLKFVEIIHRGGQRLRELIKNLLDASQIDSGRLKLNKEKANLIEIIKNCINYVEFLVENRKILLDYELPEELFIEIDKIRIEQVFTNLLSNAIKNTPSNGNICLNVREEENHIYISIKDTGVGLTKKEMNKIFKKFGKIERYGKELDVDIEGSGLGLYISKEIVNLHGGVIWVESMGRNKGATFTIKLPTRK